MADKEQIVALTGLPVSEEMKAYKVILKYVQ